jgi:hypothetical protein
MFQEHRDEDVRLAVIRLCDALCTWERATGRQNLLVLIEQDHAAPQNRFEFVADCGKPITDDGRAGLAPEDFVKAHCANYKQT